MSGADESPNQIGQSLGAIASLRIVTDDNHVTDRLTDLLHLARTHRLSLYDAIYLDLAVREHLALATVDAALATAAGAAGVPLI